MIADIVENQLETVFPELQNRRTLCISNDGGHVEKNNKKICLFFSALLTDSFCYKFTNILNCILTFWTPCFYVCEWGGGEKRTYWWWGE